MQPERFRIKIKAQSHHAVLSFGAPISISICGKKTSKPELLDDERAIVDQPCGILNAVKLIRVCFSLDMPLQCIYRVHLLAYDVSTWINAGPIYVACIASIYSLYIGMWIIESLIGSGDLYG